jgi:hypothetical protein
VPPCGRHLAREALPGIAQLAPPADLLEQLVDLRALPQLERVLALALVSISGAIRGR